MNTEISDAPQRMSALSRETWLRRFQPLAPLERLMRAFSPGDRLVLYVLSAILAVSTLALAVEATSGAAVTIPARGGSITEGEVGPVRFINPLLAVSQADEDLAALVYSGLVRATPEGAYIPDIASGYEISEDGTVYTFHIRQNATFHDGTPVTAADVLFTVALAQNANVKSTRRADWEGVTASSPDEHTVVFTLPHAYAPFIENATLGILPKHLWQDTSAEDLPFSPINTHPIGSGPYKVAHVDTDATGAATRYDLAPFDAFALGSPHLKRITFRFYPNDDALIGAWNKREVSAVAGVTPELLADLSRTDANVVRAPLPRTFGVFFNQNRAQVLADAQVRAALDAAIDKKYLIKTILGGYGVAQDGPIPQSAFGGSPAEPTPLIIPAAASSTPDTSNAASARTILEKASWQQDEKAGTWKDKKGDVLTFTLATADEPELVATANALAAMWQAAGIKASVQVYPLADLNTNVIRPRSYDAVLFGEIVGRSLDLFAFWHSSQRTDPGLNLAMYANSTADSLLAEGRTTSDADARTKLYEKFASIVEKDRPAVFLYAPDFIYIIPRDLSGVRVGALTVPAERFLNVYEWYTDTERVWSVFAK